jgi:hypothetical protein
MIGLKLILNQGYYALSDMQISSTLSMGALRKFFGQQERKRGKYQYEYGIDSCG